MNALERLTAPERRDLIEYANTHGRKWKSFLRLQWANGGSLLRETRNVLGPSGLDDVRLTNARMHDEGFGCGVPDMTTRQARTF